MLVVNNIYNGCAVVNVLLLVDECKAGTDDCSDNSVCTDTAGDYECTCHSGFDHVLADGTQCDGKNWN